MTADLFTQAPATDWVAAATRKGATFVQLQGDPHGNRWAAQAHRRGRALPLVQFNAPTQQEAAQAFCAYFHIRG